MKAGLHLVVPCEQCGKPYRQWRSDQRFCGRLCVGRAWRARNPQKVTEHRRQSKPLVILEKRRCKRCAKFFMPLSVRHTYCSQRCKQGWTGVGSGGMTKGRELVPRRNCEVCGARFRIDPVRLKRPHQAGRFCSNPCRAKYFASHLSEYPQMQAGHRWKGGRRPDLENRYFRSSWEANYARYLNWLVARGEIQRWEYEVDTFEFPIKRGSRFYTPDFKVYENDGRIVYHEVKGYMRPESATKLKRMGIHHPTVEILLIDRNVYYDLQRKLAALIDGWERAA